MLIETVRERMYAAMKAKQKAEKDVYAFALSQLEAARKAKQTADNPNPTLTDDEAVEVLRKLVKQTQAVIDEIRAKMEKNPDAYTGANKASAEEFFAEREFELKILSEFLPKLMSEDEIALVIADSMKAAGIETLTGKNKGLLMRELMPRVKGKADGKMVNDIVTKMMN